MIAHKHQPSGIDKLTLTTTEFSITDVKPLNIQPVMKFAGQDTVNEANNFLFKCNSEPVYGSKAFLNTDDFQVNINGFGLGVTFNPSKYLHPFELLTNSALLADVCQDVENKLAEACIRLSLNACKVSRVDIAKQAEMPRQVSYYAPAFDQMKFKGVRSNNVNHGAETFSTRNKTVEACFYDKRKELNPAGMPSNFMRAELRLRNSGGVKRYAGVSNLGQLIQMNQEGWNYVYTDYLGRKVFADNTEQLTFDYAGLDALVNFLVTSNPDKRGHITTAVEVIGVKQVFDQIGIDKFLAAFIPYVDASTIRRAKQRLLERAKLSEFVSTPVNTLELINELKHQFINAAA